MLKYCFITDEETGLVQLGVGCPDEYYIEIGMKQREVEQSEKDFEWYLTEKCPHYTPEEKLNISKKNKIAENDKKRNEALNQGVEYKNVLFDSDTDQKVNLIAMVETMDESQTIIWFGKDNQPLECNKQDLINIGGLITQLHSFCWGRNYEIKEAISACQTIEEVEAIEISYDIGE